MTRDQMGAVLFSHGWHLRNSFPTCDYWHRGVEWIEIHTFGARDAHYGVGARCIDIGSRAGIAARHAGRKNGDDLREVR